MSNLKSALLFIAGIIVGGGGATVLQAGPLAMAGMDMKAGDPMAGMDHSQMASDTAAQSGTGASTGDYKVAMDKMMAAMMVPYTGDADVDFAAGMIPHHQGAIDMAKVVLQYGKDAEIRKLAEEVVAAQESEITFMQNWLKANKK